MFLFSGCESGGVLAPWLGMEHMPSALESEVLITRPPEKSLSLPSAYRNLGTGDLLASQTVSPKLRIFYQYRCLKSFVSPMSDFSQFHIQFSSVAQSCPSLCNPMNCSMPGLPVHHQLLEFTQTHMHRVSDAIQPSHHLSSPSPPASNPSQHQILFQWVNISHEVVKVLEFPLQHHSFQRNPRADLLLLACLNQNTSLFPSFFCPIIYY